ncbi:MAG TPA: 50S ribosomal protein L4 [Methylomirabilota bacterium]|nr:50S ribosomal protein L4 [Methylomirabilota bacterium]
MPSLPIVDASGKSKGTVELADAVFGGAVSVPIVHQAVVRELADRRAGTHSTRGRSQVRGGGRKPWRQKGTGRARQGSIRATQWKGGGKPFGPKPRKYDKAMPTEMRRAALRSALAAKVTAGEITVVDALGLAEAKTRTLVARLKGLGATGPTLLVLAERSAEVERAAANVPWLVVTTAAHASVYQLVRHGRIVAERAALLALQEALAR